MVIYRSDLLGPTEQFLGYRIGNEPPFYAEYRLREQDMHIDKKLADRLREIIAARQKKDDAWKEIEASASDNTALWLNLGLTCGICGADEGEAALHVALLSNPDKSQAEQAISSINLRFLPRDGCLQEFDPIAPDYAYPPF